MIVVAGTIGFASGELRDAAVHATIELQRATRAEEPGCLAYCFAADPVAPTTVQVYELWTDEGALAAHFQHPNYHAMRAVLRRFERSGPSSTSKYRCDRSEPVYGADGRPNPRFATPT